MATKIGVVYLLSSRKHGTLYLGVTSNLQARIYQHKMKFVEGFSKEYSVDKLVWFEVHERMDAAIVREKQLKKWKRDWKIRLIEEKNPEWVDLFQGICT